MNQFLDSINKLILYHNIKQKLKSVENYVQRSYLYKV